MWNDLGDDGLGPICHFILLFTFLVLQFINLIEWDRSHIGQGQGEAYWKFPSVAHFNNNFSNIIYKQISLIADKKKKYLIARKYVHHSTFRISFTSVILYLKSQISL